MAEPKFEETPKDIDADGERKAESQKGGEAKKEGVALIGDLHDLPEAIIGRGLKGELDTTQLYDYATDMYKRAVALTEGIDDQHKKERDAFLEDFRSLCDKIPNSRPIDRQLDGKLYNRGRGLYSRVGFLLENAGNYSPD